VTLRTSVVQVWDLLLDNIDGASSLAASLFKVVELIKGRIDTTAADGVRWGTRSVLVANLLHLPELKIELELRGSRHKRT
jgi:hypothetical protein